MKCLCGGGSSSRRSSTGLPPRVDSLDLVELVMDFEEEGLVTIPNDEAEKITGLGDLIDYFLRRPPDLEDPV